MSSNEELEEMIRHLQTRMVYLEGRVAQLEAGRNPSQFHQWPWLATKPTNAHCSACGMNISSIVGYSCGNTHCPINTRSTCVVTGTTYEKNSNDG